MKKVLLSLVVLASVSLAFGQNYSLKDYSSLINKGTKSNQAMQGEFDSNLDFEMWNGSYAQMGFGYVPVGWFMLTGNPDAQKSENAQSGSFAMHIENNVATNAMLGWNDTLVGGVAFIGSVGMGDIVQSEAYTERPTSVSFYLRGNLLGSDTSLVALQLKNDDLVGVGIAHFGSGDITEEWQQFTIDIEYESDANPSEISMMITSTGHGVYQGINIGTVTAGSYIEFDNMKLNFGGTGIEETNWADLSVYPNPANNTLTVRNALNSEVSIYNIAGQKVLSTSLNNTLENINVSELQSGTYFLRITKFNQIHTQKINIVR